MDGFATAFSEITLVLFTTLAPSGAVGYVLMSLPVLLEWATGEARVRLNRLSCLPLGVAMVGLIASATHLGNPANALYVFTGVGRSPLSTEVFCAVVFLFLAGVFWLYAFAEKPRTGLQRALLVLIDGAALVFVAGVAFAYQVDTIISWSLPLVPATLALGAFMGGPMVALAGWKAANCAEVPGCKSAAKGLVALATAAFALSLVAYGVLSVQLGGLSNELAAMADLVPSYGAFIVVFAVVGAAGLVAAARAVAADLAPRPVACACILVFTALFVMRFAFYATHLTVGLGV